MNPLVSVMIPVYNGEAYIRDAVDSVLQQSYRPIEIIVIDDGSEDGTAAVLEGYGDLVRYVRQDRAGNGAARNQALALANGSLFTFLDADDRFSANALDRLTSTLEQNPHIDAVYAHVREFISPDIDAAALARLRSPLTRIAGRLPTNMLMRREAFLQVGEFRTDLRVGVTVDWSARAEEAGMTTVLLDDVLFERRLHAGNNGIREREYRNHYIQVVKAALDRRRALREHNVAPVTQRRPGDQLT